MKTAKIWTEETLAFFKEIYASTSNAELAALLGISVSSIKKKASELKLIKTAGYKLTEDVKKTILEKYYTQSYESIAKDLHISKRTVLRFIGEQKKKGLKPRDRETDKKIMSEYRIKQYKSERSRASFGIEQKTRYKMFPNKKKYWIRQRLLGYGYLLQRNGMIVIITPYTKRHQKLEASAKKNGFGFIEKTSNQEFTILSINYPDIMNTTNEKEETHEDELSYPMSYASDNGPAEDQIAAEYGMQE
jgi:biotin operon repressor